MKGHESARIDHRGANRHAVAPGATDDANGPQIGAERFRCIWDLPGTPFPAWADHHDEQSAHLFALRKSREIGGEVAVVRVGEGLS